jgi:hypothetical protein
MIGNMLWINVHNITILKGGYGFGSGFDFGYSVKIFSVSVTF